MVDERNPHDPIFYHNSQGAQDHAGVVPATEAELSELHGLFMRAAQK